MKADVRRQQRPPHRQSLAQISAELASYVVTLYNQRKGWPLQVEVVPASKKDPEGWGATDKFTVVLVCMWVNAIELSAYAVGGACSPSTLPTSCQAIRVT